MVEKKLDGQTFAIFVRKLLTVIFQRIFSRKAPFLANPPLLSYTQQCKDLFSDQLVICGIVFATCLQSFGKSPCHMVKLGPQSSMDSWLFVMLLHHVCPIRHAGIQMNGWYFATDWFLFLYTKSNNFYLYFSELNISF